MSGTGGDAHAAAGTSFREAIANWRLQLHTEVKKASALPTAMLDACDPMLETRLAETAETMLARLQEPDPSIADRTADGEPRLEVVTPEELRQLPGRIGTVDDQPLVLPDGVGAEYLGILVDACCTAPEPQQQDAVRRICQDFGVDRAGDLGELTQLLAQQAAATLAGEPTASGEQDLAAVCRRVVAAVAVHRALHRQEPGP